MNFKKNNNNNNNNNNKKKQTVTGSFNILNTLSLKLEQLLS